MTAAIYARKSTDQTGIADEQKSVARQVEHAKAYAASKGWTVAEEHIYVDDGVSGGEFANRPGFVRLMNNLKPRPAFQVLIMSELSRLGREQLETGFAIKQLAEVGVAVWSYLDGREILLDTPTDKFLMSAVNFAAELEREKARQRTYDAMLRRAKAGYATGGRTFGYDNVRIDSHVERRINEAEAVVVRRIFRLCAEGHGVKNIAKTLNSERAVSPRAQLGRSHSWAPSCVREVLFRDVYRGIVRWNKTRKRNQWGKHKQTDRPATDWLEVPAPQLRIVEEPLWKTAHARLDAARALYLRGTKGRAFGRPSDGKPSKYLLTGLCQCGECGSGLVVKSRSHGRRRAYFYSCGGYHDRGAAVCSNYTEIPMDDGNGIVIEALLDEVLDESLITEAVTILRGTDPTARVAAVEAELAMVNQERARLVSAIAAGGQLDGLLQALQARETRRVTLEAQRDQLRAERRLRARSGSCARRVTRARCVLAAGARR